MAFKKKTSPEEQDDLGLNPNEVAEQGGEPADAGEKVVVNQPEVPETSAPEGHAAEASGTPSLVTSQMGDDNPLTLSDTGADMSDGLGGEGGNTGGKHSGFYNDQGEAYLTEKTSHGLVIKKPIIDEMRKSYLDYAMSVIVARALPDVRDGLKPVHRRILFAMSEMGIRWNTPYKKSARIVGEVLGKYHPHGDTAVYDAMVRLAQDFSMRYPLIDGQGNFGSVDGDSPAAMRYTEARMSRISEEILQDIHNDTVDFVDNFDGSQQEPRVLPGKLPNLLLMGAEGIAVGMATKIPPHNLNEVSQAIIETIQKGRAEVPEHLKPAEGTDPADAAPAGLAGVFQSEITIDDIMEHIQGPDFPTAGYIYDWTAIKEAYATGRGRVTIRGKAEIVESGRGHAIEITELPYQVNKAKLITKIADLVRNKKLEGISNLRDESDRKGMTITVEIKRGARPKAILNNLFKYTELQTNFSMNMVALNSDGTPQLMNIRKVLMEYVAHRQLVTVRRFQNELKGLRDRAHILEGLLIALANLDEVIKTIRESEDQETAKARLTERFKLSERQAVAILDMQLRRLAALERMKIEDEYKAIKARIDEVLDIITNPSKILDVIVGDLKGLMEQYGDERRTRLVKGKVGEINEEDLVPDEAAIIAYTDSGYIKRMKPDAYRVQRRGGRGVSGMKTKEDDPIKEIIVCRTHDTLLLFTNTGRVFSTKVYELPEGSRQAKGTALVNVVNLEGEEVIRTILVLPKNPNKEQKNILFATREGKVKKTPIADFRNIRSTGIIAIALKGQDQVVFTKLSSGEDDILLVTHDGKCIRFNEKEVKESARDTQGVLGMKLKKDDFVVGGQAFPKELEQPSDKRRRFFHQLLIVTSRGMGKRTDLDEYPNQKRSGQGVKVSEITDKTGKVAAALIVTHEHEDLILTTQEAQVIKLPIKNVPVLKRPTQGVILMRMPAKDRVVGAAVTVQDLEEEKMDQAVEETQE